MAIDSLILGDNSFYGINHRSRREAGEKTARFSDPRKIADVFEIARRHGAGGVFLTAHANVDKVLKETSERKDLSDFSVYANIPYLMKYVSEVTKHGVLGVAADLVKGRSGFENFMQMTSGGLGVMSKDYYRLLRTMIELEMSKYRQGKVKAVFLHNGIVDLLLGLGAHEPFLFFDEYIRKKFSTLPGYGTLNLVRLVNLFKKIGLKDPLILAPVNPLGFFMNPSREACEEVIKDGGFTLLAMNVLAQGAVSPGEAFRYLAGLRVRHAVIGASTESHIAESFSAAKTHLTS